MSLAIFSARLTLATCTRSSTSFSSSCAAGLLGGIVVQVGELDDAPKQVLDVGLA